MLVTLATNHRDKSFDHVFDISFPFEPSQALVAAAAIGVDGTIVYRMASQKATGI